MCLPMHMRWNQGGHEPQQSSKSRMTLFVLAWHLVMLVMKLRSVGGQNDSNYYTSLHQSCANSAFEFVVLFTYKRYIICMNILCCNNWFHCFNNCLFILKYVHMFTYVHFQCSYMCVIRIHCDDCCCCCSGSVLSCGFFPLGACAPSCCAKPLCGDNGRWGDQFKMRGSDEAFCQSPKGIHNPACLLMAVFSTAMLPQACLIIHTRYSLSPLTNMLTSNIPRLTWLTQLELYTLYYVVVTFLFLLALLMLYFSFLSTWITMEQQFPHGNN